MALGYAIIMGLLRSTEIIFSEPGIEAEIQACREACRQAGRHAGRQAGSKGAKME
jgi:hypothetical protein